MKTENPQVENIKERLQEFGYEYNPLSKNAILARNTKYGQTEVAFVGPSFVGSLSALAHGTINRRYERNYEETMPQIYAGFSSCCNDYALALKGNPTSLEIERVSAPRMNICAILPILERKFIEHHTSNTEGVVEQHLEGMAQQTKILVTGDGCDNGDHKLGIVNFMGNDIIYIEGAIPKFPKFEDYPVYGFAIDQDKQRVYTRNNKGERITDITSALDNAGIHIPKTLELNQYFRRFDSCDLRDAKDLD